MHEEAHFWFATSPICQIMRFEHHNLKLREKLTWLSKKSVYFPHRCVDNKVENVTKIQICDNKLTRS